MIQGVNFPEAAFANSIFTDDFGKVHAAAFSYDSERVVAGTKVGTHALDGRHGAIIRGGL